MILIWISVISLARKKFGAMHMHTHTCHPSVKGLTSNSRFYF